MIEAIELNLDGKTVRVSLDEARRLLGELKTLFGDGQVTHIPIYPWGWPPVYPTINPQYPLSPTITLDSGGNRLL